MKGWVKSARIILCAVIVVCGFCCFGVRLCVAVSAAFECEHAAVTVPERRPTCTEEGATAWSYCKLCDEILSFGETVAPLGHDVVTETVAPACTEQGYDWEHCTRCGDIDRKTGVTEALGHTERAIAPIAATCVQAGRTAGRECTVCGEITQSPQEIPSLGHAWEERQTMPPSCEIAGEAIRACLRCGEEEKKELPSSGHNWSDCEVTAAPSCTEAGTREKRCYTCGNRSAEAVPPLGHNRIDGEGKFPACTADGYTAAAHCSVCGIVLEESRPIPALGHEWGEWSERRAPNCVLKGLLVRACLRENCGQTEQRETDCLPHAAEALSARPAGCESAGLTEGSRCKICGERLTEQTEIPPLGHIWGDWREVKPPDYREAGTRVRSCLSCKDTQAEQIEKLGGYGEKFLLAVDEWKNAAEQEKAEYMKRALALYGRVERKNLVAEEYGLLCAASSNLPKEGNNVALIVGLSCGGAAAVGGTAGAIGFLKRRKKK